MINIKENEKLSIMNHSCAHLMAQAIKHLYPNAKFWVGPVIEEGFYYDIDLGDVAIKEEALERFKDDPYKVDLIERMDEKETRISCYTQGDFTVLCRGSHVETVKVLKNFKLLKFSGAYWKGDSNNKMLQRIYGVCFETEEVLNKYLEYIKRRNNEYCSDNIMIKKDISIEDIEIIYYSKTKEKKII